MAEEPTKLFASRAERYPQSTAADAAQGTARAALAAIPLVGGSITEVLSMVLAPAVERRKDQWLRELADGLDEVEAKVDGFKIENLQHDEAFVSAVIQASRSAISTHKQEKREALRNALLNIALGRGPGQDEEQIFLRYIDELTPWHIRILKCLVDKEAEKKFLEVNQNMRSGATSFAWCYERLLIPCRRRLGVRFTSNIWSFSLLVRFRSVAPPSACGKASEDHEVDRLAYL
jgi:hypothetical protein